MIKTARVKKKTKIRGPKTTIDPDRKILKLITETAHSKKGEDILVVNLAGIFYPADYFVIITGKNLPHIQTLVGKIQDTLMDEMHLSARQVGLPESRWMILDYGNIIVHIIGAREREHYSLEKLWAQAQVSYHI